MSIRVAIKKVQKQGKYKLSKAGHFLPTIISHVSTGHCHVLPMLRCAHVFFCEENFEKRNNIINEYNSFLELLFTYHLPSPWQPIEGAFRVTVLLTISLFTPNMEWDSMWWSYSRGVVAWRVSSSSSSSSRITNGIIFGQLLALGMARPVPHPRWVWWIIA